MQSLDAAFYDSAYRVAVTLVCGYGLSELGRVGLCAHLDQSGMDSDAFEPQGLFGDTSGDYASCRLARRSPAAATPVADTVFLLVGLVGMSGAVAVFEKFVVFGPCIFIADEECNRGT